AVALLPGDVHTPGEFALYYACALISVIAAVLWCVCFARRNWLAYALVLWVAALRAPLSTLFGNGSASLEMQGWIVPAGLAVTLVWTVAPGPRAPAAALPQQA